jgi:hypothetical protein
MTGLKLSMLPAASVVTRNLGSPIFSAEKVQQLAFTSLMPPGKKPAYTRISKMRK